MDGYERAAELAKALGHPIRLLILEELRRGEACVCHLEAMLGQRQAYISQQLARLRNAGLVVDRRDGTNIFYALADESVGLVIDSLRGAATYLDGEDTLDFAVPERKPCTCPKCQPETADAHPEAANAGMPAE